MIIDHLFYRGNRRRDTKKCPQLDPELGNIEAELKPEHSDSRFLSLIFMLRVVLA